MRSLIALVLLTGIAFAQSQEPTPSNGPSGQSAQPAAPDERGTEKVPLTVKILPAEGSAEQAAKAERDSREKAKIDEKIAFETQRVADYTERLAWFTLLLFCVAVGQAGLFVWQLLYMRRGLRDAEDAALTARLTAETAKEQVAVTKMGIIDLERAHLAVGPTKIYMDFVPKTDGGYYKPTDRMEVTAKLSVMNTGRTSATIKRVYGIFSESLPESDTPIYPALVKPIDTDLALLPGIEQELTPFNFQSDFTGEQSFWGYVEYWDIFKIKRTSRFCMRIFPAPRGPAGPKPGKMQLDGTEAWRECD